MSIIATVSIPEGIIMAADSRITGITTYENENGKQVDRHTISDNGQKLFNISKRIGISCCGDMRIGGVTITEFMRNFEIECCKENITIEDCAKNLAAYTRLKGNQANIVYHVCGYSNGNQVMFRIQGDNISHINTSYGAAWDGEAEILRNLLIGPSPLNLKLNEMYLKDGIEFAQFLVDVTCKTQRFSTGIPTCGGPIDILLITKDEARWIKHKILNP